MKNVIKKITEQAIVSSDDSAVKKQLEYVKANLAQAKSYTVGELQNSIECVPAEKGVYFIGSPENENPILLTSDPSKPEVSHNGEKIQWYPLDMLKGRLEKDAKLLYIGKATDLNKRLNQYMNYNKGSKGTAHNGGRAIWQLEHVEKMSVLWIPFEADAIDPEIVETALIKAHQQEYGDMPLANQRA